MKMNLKKEQKITNLFFDYRDKNNQTSFNNVKKELEKYLVVKISYYIYDKEICKELLQKTWISVNQNKEKFDPSKGTLLNWIFYKYTRGHILHWFRDKNRSIVIFMDPVGDEKNEAGFFDSKPGEIENPHEVIEAKEYTQNIHKATFKLKDEYQDVIILYHLGGIPLEQIAKMMNKPHATIRTWHNRAKEELSVKLRNLIKNLTV